MGIQRKKSIHYIHFDTVDSTSTWTKKNTTSLDPFQLTCITALEQTAGRGRFLRKWLSPKGQNIYASLYFTVPIGCSYLVNLGQVLSLSCITTLEKKGFYPQIKWPNDILLDHKKVAGILCETVVQDDQIGVVLSIGINVNMSKEMLDSIDQPATSLAQLSGQTWTLEQILEPLLTQFLVDLEILETEGFVHFLDLYVKLLAYKGETIQISDGVNSIKGICHSINSDGRLNLLLPDGTMSIITAGEIKTIH